MEQYQQKAIPTIIKFASRASIKANDNFFTIEYGEERQITDFKNTDIDKERQLLIDDCNTQVDKQIQEILDNFIRKK